MDGNSAMLKALKPFRQFVAQTRLEMNQAHHERFFTEMLDDIDQPTSPFGLSNRVDRDAIEINAEHLELSATLNGQLRAHARNLKISLASICHLAWAQVLARASGHDAVVFGTVLFGRLQTDSNIMCPMINTLPLRLNVDDGSVETAVVYTHVRLSALLANEHASLVFAQRCSRVPAGLPLFSTLLNYRNRQNIAKVKTSLPGICF